MSRAWSDFLFLIVLDLLLIQKREKKSIENQKEKTRQYTQFLKQLSLKLSTYLLNWQKPNPLVQIWNLAMVSPKRSMIPLIFNNN